MASADFCGLTRCITAGRAVWSDGSGPIRSLEIGLLDLAPGRIRYGTTRPSLPSAPHRQGAQIAPARCANCRCTSAAFTVGCVPVGFAAMCCQLVLILLTMSPSRYSRRGLAPYKFAPMLGAHHSLNRAHCGRPASSIARQHKGDYWHAANKPRLRREHSAH